jgi:hypothetical protein
MLDQPADEATVTSSHDFKRFMRSIRKKNLLDIISCADQEATAAWRSAYHSTKAVKSGEAPDLYAGFLEELVAFLRAAVVYRPLSIPEEVFDQFLQLRRSLHRQR